MNGILENLRVERDILREKVREQSEQVLPFLVDLKRVHNELRDVALACDAYEGNARKDFYLDSTITTLDNLISNLTRFSRFVIQKIPK